jgi:hypothetical protein
MSTGCIEYFNSKETELYLQSRFQFYKTESIKSWNLAHSVHCSELKYHNSRKLSLLFLFIVDNVLLQFLLFMFFSHN